MSGGFLLEQGVIGMFCMPNHDIGVLREIIGRTGLKGEHFSDAALRTAFEAVQSAGSNDSTLIRSCLMSKLGVESIEKCIEKSFVSSVDFEIAARKLADNAKILNLKNSIDKAVAESIDTSDFPSFCHYVNGIVNKQMAGEASGKDDGIRLADFADPVPEKDNPNALIAGGWLRKGGAALLVSVSGSGKSVISIQLAYALALGREMFGIRPMRPLRIAIFQTEDDEDEIGEFRRSMRAGYRTIHGWTDEDIRKAEANIVFYDTNGATNEGFVERLRKVQRRERFDFVIVNPLQGVTGFDISQNNELSRFLRGGIDSVIKDDDRTKCGLLVIHHTNKPPSARERAGYGSDQFAEYVGAGGAELTNWIRAILTLIPTAEPGVYRLSAVKRGKRLKWPELARVKTAHPTKIIRHADRESKMLFWLEDESATLASPDSTVPAFDINAAAARLAEELKLHPQGQTGARNLARELFKRKNGDKVYDLVINNLTNYGLAVNQQAHTNLKLIGPVQDTICLGD